MITSEQKRLALHLLKTAPAVEMIALLEILAERMGIEAGRLVETTIIEICTELREEEQAQRWKERSV